MSSQPSSRQLASVHAGGRVEGTVVQIVPELRYVPDEEAQHYDAVVTELLVPDETLGFSGICLLEVGTRVEIKSAVVQLNSGGAGRLYFRRQQHEKLLEEAGVYLFAVASPDPSRDVLALRVVPASLVDEILPDWRDGGEGRAWYTQLAWSRLIDQRELAAEEVVR